MKPGVALHGELSGSGADLVLLHPAGLDGTFMRSVAAAAAPTHRVLCLDLRGHGLSPDAAAGTSLENHAADVSAAIRLHCRGPAIVLGLSLGGMVAQTLALADPEAVAGLLLCGCPGGFAPEVRPLLRERGLAAERGGMAAVVEATLARWFTPAFLEDASVATVRERLLHDKVSNWSATWHAIAGFDAHPRLGSLRVPTAVIAGEQDAATAAAATTALAAAIPHARRRIVPRAPHMMQVECAQAFNRTVLDCLAEMGSAWTTS